MGLEYRKYCMICSNPIYKPIPGISVSGTERKEMHEYENPICIWCGNDKYFIEYEYDLWDKKSYRNKQKFEQNLKLNPYYDLERARRAQEKMKNINKIAFSDRQRTYKENSTPNIPKCPTCGSTDIKDISTLNRMVSVGAFGLASDKIGKTKECKNCGYKW